MLCNSTLISSQALSKLFWKFRIFTQVHFDAYMYFVMDRIDSDRLCQIKCSQNFICRHIFQFKSANIMIISYCFKQLKIHNVHKSKIQIKLFGYHVGAIMAMIIWYMQFDIQLHVPMQSVPITTDVVIRTRCTTLCDKVCQ